MLNRGDDLAIFLFRRYLKDDSEGAFLVCSDRLFHSRIAEGMNELLYNCVRQ